jgi:hypothetical protein
VAENHQTFRVKNAPVTGIFKNKSVVLYPLPCLDHSTALHIFTGKIFLNFGALSRLEAHFFLREKT